MSNRSRHACRLTACVAAVLVGLTSIAVAAPIASAAAVAVRPVAAAPGPSGSPEWWFDRWQIEDLWAAGYRGQGVTIAEIDTGVNAQLPELEGRILAGTDLGQDGDGRIDRQVKAFGHGTAMASLMVARPGLFGITGLAPAAKILPVAVPLNGTTDSGGPDKLGEAIRYAADHGAQVISMSLGGKRSPKYDSASCPPEEQSAVYYALSKGAVLLAAVGNTGATDNAIEEPGVCLGVVSVGAVDINGQVASFSARQPYLSLVAPGVNIPSLGRIEGEGFAGDGTSQATAITSASVALMMSARPDLSSRQAVSRLLATLDQHRSTPSSEYGYGELNAYQAVTAHVPTSAPNPIYDAVTPFLRREAALAQPDGPRPPAPAASGPPPGGSFAVGGRAGLPTQILPGVLVAGAGLLLLVVLAISATRRRRARAAFATRHPPPSSWPDLPPG